MGRPKSPVATRKSRIIGIRFSAEQQAILKKAVSLKGSRLTVWAREVLLAAAQKVLRN